MELELYAFRGLRGVFGYEVHLMEGDKIVWSLLPHLFEESYSYEIPRGLFRRFFHLKPRKARKYRLAAPLIRGYGGVAKMYYDYSRRLLTIEMTEGLDYPEAMHELVARTLGLPVGTRLRIVTQTMWGVEGYSSPTYRTEIDYV